MTTHKPYLPKYFIGKLFLFSIALCLFFTPFNAIAIDSEGFEQLHPDPSPVNVSGSDNPSIPTPTNQNLDDTRNPGLDSSRGPTIESPRLDTGAKITNPLKVNSITCLLSELLKIVVDIGAIIAVLFFIWSGFLYVKAQGNPEAIKEAHRAFTYTVIGTALILGGFVIARVIVNTIGRVTQSNITFNSCP